MSALLTSGCCYREEEVAEFQEFARSPQLYDNIQTRIAPGIFGHDNIKKAIACLLFGGTRKVVTVQCTLRRSHQHAREVDSMPCNLSSIAWCATHWCSACRTLVLW